MRAHVVIALAAFAPALGVWASSCSVYDSSLLAGSGGAAGNASTAAFGGQATGGASTSSSSSRASSSGTGGSGGCTTAADCPGSDTACKTRTCNAGACGETDAPAGPAMNQQQGDCSTAVCDGHGGETQQADDADLPSDGKECTDDTCSGGSPVFTPKPVRTPCAGGAKVCDAAGDCVECVDGSDCPSHVCSANHTCPAATCSDGVQNGDESDIDCGGSCAKKCAPNLHCMTGADCQLGACSNGLCVCPDGPHVVFSEIRSRGPAGSGDEFVELYNPTPAAVALDASWHIDGRSDTAGSYTTRWTGAAGKTIAAHGHFLIGGSSYAGTVDGTMTSITDATSLKLVQSGATVDAVCYAYSATTAGHFGGTYTCEGTVIPFNPHDNSSATNTDASIERRPGGAAGNCIDTDDNAADFQAIMPSTPETP
ncbi:MAG TPA: lamin tail domain-containing protein [Minicystis sp.]|nr:lamin tail domain-containing protein [Minicystis sp.]